MKSPLQWLFVASITMVSGISFSQTRYVSTTGTDVSNDCQTPGNPCGTISHAYSEAIADDTIKIAPGNYNLTSTLSLLQPVVIAALDPMDLPVITSSASDVISVNSDDVTIMNLHFEMGLTASTGLRGIVANTGDFDNLKVSGNIFESTNPISGTPNTNMVWTAFAISLVATSGDVQNVTIEDNEIIADATSNVFGRGIFLGNGGTGLDAPGGTISGNTIKAYYAIQSALIADDLSISDNDIDGTVLIIAPKAGVIVDVEDNMLGNNTQMTPASYYAVLELRSIEVGDVNVSGNQFSNYVNIGLLSEASKNVSVLGNIFTPDAAASGFTSIMANTKLMTNGAQGNTYSDEITIQGNTFNAGLTGQGTAILFADHYGVNTPAFGNITIGGAGVTDKNTFNSNLGTYIALDELSGPSTAFPLWATYPATTMAPFSQDVEAYAIYNNYGLANFAAIEAKNNDQSDEAGLGKIYLTAYGENRYVSTTGTDVLNTCTLPGSPCLTIAHAISVAIDEDSVIVYPGSYALTSVLNIGQDGLVLTASDVNDKPVITTNQANIIDVNAEDVTVNGFEFRMGLTNATGIKGVVSTASNFNNLKVSKNDFISTAALDLEGMVWSAFAVQLTSATGEIDTVEITDNGITTAATNLNVFGRGFYLGSGSANGPGGLIANNQIQAYYAIQTANIATDLTVESNDINGISMFSAPLNNSLFDVYDNTFSGANMNTNMTSDSLYAVVEIRGIASGSIEFYDNTIEGFSKIGLLSSASKDVIVDANVFTPKATATAFTSLMANTKLMTNGVQGNTYSDEITIIGNTFSAGATNGGTAIIFADHYGVNTPAFADITVGGAATAEKNIFNASLGKYIVLDNKTGTSASEPLWAVYDATNMKPVTQNVEALYVNNTYNFGSTGEVELKNIDSVDNVILGKVILAYSFVGLDELTSADATLYPNPAINAVTIELTDLNAVVEMTVVDLVGNVVYNSTINGSITVDVSNLTSGVYVVRLNNKGQVSSTRFVKN
ncbi:T9SS type A sorting domain-containing protein [Fluviicola taffensis]|uniref:Secretion system C-terminal sorting domain-containing protein n=1 Tax=Fluviicola taffensis (strain DSM 16823 / NCIMB 13979 / RW262) TaxID=755732 RepID=F2IER5_FLUTR|nr:T9SS type A sorting domain-containing protein [Fluviicola taffensis]AEA45632.1 hypothetical protein Fluta_3663 [Fluviicola taffensis DSM 16823]